MVSRLCGKVCAPGAQGSPGRRGRLGFRLPGSRPRDIIETAESLNVWSVNFNAVVGGADGCLVYPQTGAVCGYLEELAPLRKNAWRQFRPRRCGGLGTRPRSGLAVTACVEAETGFGLTPEAVLVV
ncbi:hypothetical protein EVAR_63421_1 [Eumeta japonica]|uniref:Uncharacterized protein n=1 Tax=Eumeta variegata TaxID=151549 RepID=A0A4C1ZPU8_EUMVA|nr:hypothetical protein EVAR_63421_1 [Eumeta japonica]